ncbi:MAG TPA: hypothetical protein PK181_09640 [Methanothrix soehngenii]|jgi:hypothetical protein|nr:hypothetical protein [Methanothrix soehngenii]
MDLSWVELVVAVVLPVLVGLVTKEVTSSGVKAVLLAALSALAGLGTAYVNSNGVLSTEALQGAVEYFVIAVATYYGIWKPTGVAAKAQQTLVK